MERNAVYAGSFDPVTMGHVDIIERASKLYDNVYVMIGINPGKKTLFSVDERVALLKESVKHLDNVMVDSNEGLTIDYLHKVNANVMIRGVRNVTDFEYEMQLAYCNRYIDEAIESVLLFCKPEYSFVSSSNVKEIASNHRAVTGLVPSCVEDALKTKYDM